MKVYILQEFIDSHNCGTDSRVVGVYDSEEKVKAKVTAMRESAKNPDSNFFMAYMFDEDYEEANFDNKDISEASIHLYSDGNGDEYDLYYIEMEVE